MSNYIFPSLSDYRVIESNFLAPREADDPIFRMFPIRYSNFHEVFWSQRDAYGGLMAVRGLNGPYPRVERPASTFHRMRPSSYGEHILVQNEELTIRSANLAGSAPVDARQVVTEATDTLLSRIYNRRSWLLYTLTTTGRYQVKDEGGAVLAEDAYSIQTYAASDWSTHNTATPIADFAAASLLNEGTTADFGPTAVAFMNRKTYNHIPANTNAADFGGKKGAGLASLSALSDVNEYFAGSGLPQLMPFHGGYWDDASPRVFHPWIADDTVILVGLQRGSIQIGEFQQTANGDNNGSPQTFMKAIDTAESPNAEPPRQVKVFAGFNGGPALFYPGSIIVMKV